MTDDSNPPEPQDPMTSILLRLPSNDVQDMHESPAPYSDESEPFEPGEPLPEIQHSERSQQMADDRKPPEPHSDEVDPIGPGKNIPNPTPGEWPPEVWEEGDDLNELPADADIAPDESAVDHNLPDNEGMPQ